MSGIFGKSTKEMIQYAKNVADANSASTIVFIHELDKAELASILEELCMTGTFNRQTGRYISAGKILFYKYQNEDALFEAFCAIQATHVFNAAYFSANEVSFIRSKIRYPASIKLVEPSGYYDTIGVLRWSEY